MSALFRLLQQKHNPPQPTTASFAGKTVLVTGATGGLGLEAAKKLAALNADRLVITARNDAKGQAAKQEILASVPQLTSTKTASTTEIVVLTLDMSSAAGIKSFVKELKTRISHLDAAILNAGTVQVKHVESRDGFEEDLQVNAISTILLGLLILPLLLASSNKSPHLNFISSGNATKVTPEAMQQYMKDPQPLRSMSKASNFPGPGKAYGQSKLVLEHGMRHMARLPFVTNADGSPKVIINSTCPGMCKSDIGRQYLTNPLIRIFAWLAFTIFARTATHGANSYISALTRDADGNGKLWKDDKYYDGGEMIESEVGKKFGDIVWKEMIEVLEDVDPEVRQIVQ